MWLSNCGAAIILWPGSCSSECLMRLSNFRCSWATSLHIICSVRMIWNLAGSALRCLRSVVGAMCCAGEAMWLSSCGGGGALQLSICRAERTVWPGSCSDVRATWLGDWRVRRVMWLSSYWRSDRGEADILSRSNIVCQMRTEWEG